MVGLTHASNVMRGRSTATRPSWERSPGQLVPLKLSALPYLPAAAQVVFASVPLLPFPDASATVEPDPSSKENAATGVGPLGTGVTAVAVLE